MTDSTNEFGPFDLTGSTATSLTATDVLNLVSLFDKSLERMENRLIAKMDENSQGAAARWKRHDEELTANTKRIVERFEKLEKALDEHIQVANLHWAKDEREEIANEARIKPIKGIAGWLWRNWRDLLIIAIGLMAFAAAWGEWFGRLIAPHAP
jgi:hypothetical protein